MAISSPKVRTEQRIHRRGIGLAIGGDCSVQCGAPIAHCEFERADLTCCDGGRQFFEKLFVRLRSQDCIAVLVKHQCLGHGVDERVLFDFPVLE